MRRTVLALGALAVLATACGASPQSAPPPASPAAAPAYDQHGYPQQPSPRAPPSPAGASIAPSAEAPPVPAMTPSPSTAPSARAAGRAEAVRDVEAAERDIASSDCTSACRALGSMERAVVFLCESSQTAGDAGRCTDAKGRLVAARRKVRASCGSCPNGASVDPDAPIGPRG